MIDLQDADTEQPLTVRLQYADKNGNGWQDCPEGVNNKITLAYSGSGDTWEGEMTYMLAEDLVMNFATLQQVRIVCDYTLTDGTGGTVYSTDCAKMYAYEGEYIQPVSCVIRDHTLTAVYELNPDALLNISADTITADQIMIYEGSGFNSIFDITNDAKLTVSSDGTVTVNYSFDGSIPKEPAALEDPSLLLMTKYNDQDGAIKDWESGAFIDFTYELTAPLIDLDFDLIEGLVGFGVYTTVTLNDVLDGEMTLTMYKKGPLGYEPADCDSYTYSKDDAYDGQVSGFFYEDQMYEYLHNGETERYTAKIVAEYTYADGTSGRVESPEFEQYAGEFAKFSPVTNGSDIPKIYYDRENQQFVAEVTIDPSVVDIENMLVLSTSFKHHGSWETVVTSNDDGELRPASDFKFGENTLVFTYPMEGFEVGGTYIFDAQLIYYTGYGPHWLTECYTDEITVTYGLPDTAGRKDKRSRRFLLWKNRKTTSLL